MHNAEPCRPEVEIVRVPFSSHHFLSSRVTFSSIENALWRLHNGAFEKGNTMPLSKEATEGLRAAVEYNPAAAHYFMQILRFLPLGVRYKEQDRYGPLAMMIFAIPQSIPITDQISLPVKHAKTFPAEKLKLCEIFNEEWLQRRFTKQELADIIEQILAEIKPYPLLGEVDASTTLVVTAEGTFLSHDQEMKLRIDSEQQ